MARKRYPIGIQTFDKICTEDRLYIDKTEYVYHMTHSDSNYIFLGRPRRFGKSLLVSTLQSYFEGKKELFKGLAIEKLEQDWTASLLSKRLANYSLVTEYNQCLYRYSWLGENIRGCITSPEPKCCLFVDLENLYQKQCSL